ncbi:hypothetical protein cyc_09308 [Cyclospora cayetanensis]|uniref:Uncharacterized protein n=1 Tax=Cyclospora cayetanensis TaxID=88456 RepID=A0A1D3DAX5_9EIME|nr:hypothetical protein cyc_09308 [Cyclospora cayetanensis]
MTAAALLPPKPPLHPLPLRREQREMSDWTAPLLRAASLCAEGIRSKAPQAFHSEKGVLDCHASLSCSSSSIYPRRGGMYNSHRRRSSHPDRSPAASGSEPTPDRRRKRRQPRSTPIDGSKAEEGEEATDAYAEEDLRQASHATLQQRAKRC